jgi:hypothetical protein
MPSAIAVTMQFTEPMILAVDCVLNQQSLTREVFMSKGIPVDNLTQPRSVPEASVEVPSSSVDSNNTCEMCFSCGAFFPVEELDPDTHMCLKCLKEDFMHEARANYANQD